MVSIKVIADGLSKQIEAAIAGKADCAQAAVLCSSVDSLIKLARLQIEMGKIDWEQSDERPVLEMEKVDKSDRPRLSALTNAASGSMRYSPADIISAGEDQLKAEIKLMEVELSHAEVAQAEASDGSGDFVSAEKRCKALRKYILAIREELESR